MSAQSIIRYTITQHYNFDAWVLEGSLDSIIWEPLQFVSSTAFSGKRTFDITPTDPYDFFRIRITNWLPGASKAVGEIEFFTSIDLYNTTTSSYTTTTTLTTTTASTTNFTSTISTVTQTTATYTTTLSTTQLPCNAPSFVLVSGNLLECHVYWNESASNSIYYEVQVNKDLTGWQNVDTTFNTELTYVDLTSIIRYIQFRVRALCLGYQSNWMESNRLEFRHPQADFSCLYNNESFTDTFYVSEIGETVTFIDESIESDLPIVTRNWTVYSNYDASGDILFTGTGRVLEYITDRSGVFAVSLTVVDETGLSSTKLKKSFLGVDSYLDINFYAAVTSRGISSSNSLDVYVGESITFVADVSGGDVSLYKWKFYSTDSGNSYFLEAFSGQVTNRYFKLGSFAVGLSIVGRQGQLAELIKPFFINVIAAVPYFSSTTLTTTTLSSTTTVVTTTLSTTVATTNPPNDWIRIPNDGIAFSSSEELNYEAFRAFDSDVSSFWQPELNPELISTTTTLSSTTSTSSSDSTTTFQITLPSGNFWDRTVDLARFREKFIEIFLNNRLLLVTKYASLPSFLPLLHEGVFVYDEATDSCYVGTTDGWSKVNQAQLAHAIQHTSSGSDELFVISNDPPVNPFPGQVWIDTSVDNLPSSSTTVTTTTASSTTQWQGNIAVAGSWGYNECSSFYDNDHTCDNAFDCDYETYWKSENIPSNESPEWIGYYFFDSKVIVAYRVYRANDDGIPNSWELKASINGVVWHTIHSVRDSIVELSEYLISNKTPYNYYRLYIDGTQDGKEIQLNALELFLYRPLSSSTTTSTISTTTISISTTSYF